MGNTGQVTLDESRDVESRDELSHTSGFSLECSQFCPRGKVSGAYERRLGSKANEATYKFIINQIPPHRTYIEPFLGWGAIMLHKAAATHSICIDKEAEKVSNFLLELPAAQPMMAACIVEFSEALWWTIGGDAAATGYHGTSAADEVAHAGTAAGNRKRAVKSPLLQKVASSGNSAEASRSANHTAALVVGDALSFLASYRWHGDEFVYLDPPYLPETRSSKSSRYLFDMDTADHEALLEIILDIPAKVMLSGYLSELYEDKLGDWRCCCYTGNTRGGPRTEYLWCNYPEPVELHDYRWLGKNWRERQDLNRLRKRWIAKLRKMPILKRQAMLAAIKEFHEHED